MIQYFDKNVLKRKIIAPKDGFSKVAPESAILFCRVGDFKA